MSRYSTPLGSASASASASASDSEYPLSTRFNPRNATASMHPLASGSAAANYYDDDEDDDDISRGGDGLQDDEDEEEAWDEVDIPQAAPSTSADALDGRQDANQGGTEAGTSAGAAGGIEIIIGRSTAANGKGKGKGKGKGETARERMIRQERHKVHVMALLAMGLIRNRWLNDPELQARLVSQVPAALLNAFTLITPARYPNPRDRSRLFDRALSDLTSWWYTAFEIIPDRELSRRDVVQVEQELQDWREEGERLRSKAQKRVDKEKERAAAAAATRDDQVDVKGKGKAKAREPPLEPEKIPLYPWQESPYLLTTSQRESALDKSASTSRLPLHPSSGQLIRPYEPASSSWEVVRPAPNEHMQSFHVAASTLRGSKDLSAQLFVALLRAIDIPARLVVSLQALEWRSRAQTTQPPAKAKKGGTAGKKSGGAKGKGGRVAGKRKTAPAQKAKALDTTTDDDDDEDEDGDFVAIDEEATRASRKAAKAGQGAKPARRKTNGSGSSRVKGGDGGTGSSTASASGGIAGKKNEATASKRSSAGKPAPDVLVLSSSASATTGSDTDGSFEDGRGKLKYKVPKVKLRGSTSGARMAAWKKEQELRRGTSPDAYELSIAPTQWVEAYTRYNKEWIVVDPVRKRMRCAKLMEPPRAAARGGGEGNVLAYVVAYEEDGSARDVTPRYARAFINVTLKSRVPTSSKVRKENGGNDWFAGVIFPFGRGFKLNRDVEEEEELWHRQSNAPLPTSIGGFKSHPNYVLEQHLHRDEALRPGSRSLGLFKGEFPIFRRSDVVNVRSSENWYRTGRVVKASEIPMKFVKQRAVTIHRRREEELARMDGGEVDEQPLFAEEQTEVYVPPPVIDGKVPKNNFGNIDLYMPSMLPAGAVHLRSKYAAKCAKELGIDFGEAIMGFEFRQRRALPVISGIVVAQEHADTLEAAVATLEQSTYKRELAKQQDRVLKRWKKLIQGLRIRQRLMDQFKDTDDTPIDAAVSSPQKPVTVQKRVPSPAVPVPSKPITTPRADEAAETEAKPSPSKALRGRKRSTISPSASDEAPSPKRITRGGDTGALSGVSTSGRSLRVRLPKREEVEAEPSEPTRSRSKRASAQQAKSRLKLGDVGDDSREEDDALVSEGMANGEPMGSGGSEAEFEFDDDF